MEGAVLYHSGAPERNPWCGGVTRVTSPAGRQHRENKEREEVVPLFFVCVFAVAGVTVVTYATGDVTAGA